MMHAHKNHADTFPTHKLVYVYTVYTRKDEADLK